MYSCLLIPTNQTVRSCDGFEDASMSLLSQHAFQLCMTSEKAAFSADLYNPQWFYQAVTLTAHISVKVWPCVYKIT